MTDGLGFVVGVNLVIWIGIGIYLFLLDRKVGRLERLLGEGKK